MRFPRIREKPSWRTGAIIELDVHRPDAWHVKDGSIRTGAKQLYRFEGMSLWSEVSRWGARAIISICQSARIRVSASWHSSTQTLYRFLPTSSPHYVQPTFGVRHAND